MGVGGVHPYVLPVRAGPRFAVTVQATEAGLLPGGDPAQMVGAFALVIGVSTAVGVSGKWQATQ